MMEKYLATMNISKREVLTMADKINLSYKELESFNKGKDFIDKQMEILNEEIRSKISILLLAYVIKI